MTKTARNAAPAKPAKPRRRIVTRTEEIEDDGTELLDGAASPADLDELPPDPSEEKLDALFAEARGHSDVEIRVYKLDPENRHGSRAYAMSVTLDDADSGRLMETLQKKWKGGAFELCARAEGRILRRTVVEVLPPPEAETPPAAVMQESVAAAINAAMAPMQAALAAMQQRPKLDLASLLQTPLGLALGQQLIARLFAAPAAGAPAMDLEKMLGVFSKFQELGLGGGEPSGVNQALTLFREIGKPLLETVQQAQRAGAQRGNGATRPGTVAPIPGVPVIAAPLSAVPTAQPDPAAVAIPEHFVQFLPRVLEFARSGETPEAAAETIAPLLEALPEAELTALLDGFESGTLARSLAAKPEFAPFALWLNATGAAILELFTEDETDDVSNAGEPGDATLNPDGDSGRGGGDQGDA